MFNLEDVRVLHLEPTTICQAECPQCVRTIEGYHQKSHTQHTITLDYVKSCIDINFIQQLDKMFMCGNYGDPAASHHTMSIYKYFREINPAITLGMNTNGGLQNKGWWQELATILCREKDYVVFSIDGLADTNHIYRVKVNWNNVIENTQAFIDAGGNAHWDMLVFKHNEHQVDQIQQLAKNMGFQLFRSKVTKREINVPFLVLPSDSKHTFVEGDVDCYAMKENSVFLNADGLWSPCCWLSGQQNRKDFGGSVAHYFNHILENPCQTCKNVCSVSNSKSAFTNQWKSEIQFK
jgi:MoaA/NifB/PqqE/SkfB family radical SAM enzyme